MMRRLEAWFAQERPTTLLGLARVLLSALLLKNSIGLWLSLERGYFADYFFMPVIDPALVPSELGYRWLLGIKIAASAAALIGVMPRGALLVSASIGLYVLACDRLQYHNNRYATHLLGFLLAFAPCDRSFRLPLGRARAAAPGAPGPIWAARLVQLQMSAIYFTSASGKLLGEDWRSGVVMGLRFVRGAEALQARGIALPGLAIDLMHSPLCASLMSKAAIATEMFLAFALWHPATRAAALWLGVMFHAGIEISAHVDLFSWLMLSGYVLFVTPELRERTLRYDPQLRAGRIWAALMPYLDWLMRFRLAPAPLGVPFEVEERRGEHRRGFAGFVALCRATPCLFPLWLPLELVLIVRKSRPTLPRTRNPAPSQVKASLSGH